MNVVLGIDPGLTGACALLGDGFCDVFDLPARDDAETGRRIDAVAFAALVQQRVPAGAAVRVCIEALANGGQTKGRSNFSTVGSQFWTQGSIVATLELLGLSVEFVSVQAWKRFYGLAGKKDDPAETMRHARRLVAEIYPTLADHVQRQKDHNRAESVLIAHWFRRVRA